MRAANTNLIWTNQRATKAAPSRHALMRAILTVVLILLWPLLLNDGVSQNTGPTESEIKSAYIFNFAKFVEWPPKSLPKANSPITIGILGENPFGRSLEQTIQNKTVYEHPLFVGACPPLQPTNCQILFISSSEKSRLPQIMKELKGSSVLTVADMDGFTEAGGVINFVREGTKIRFRINNDVAAKEGLKISSKLLSLAVRTGA